eukprot:5353645-Pyramimonas_sp.AAC.1
MSFITSQCKFHSMSHPVVRRTATGVLPALSSLLVPVASFLLMCAPVPALLSSYVIYRQR